jgi:C4-dicarboxylate transporter DctM subunit
MVFLVGVMMILLLLGVPVAFAIAISAAAYIALFCPGVDKVVIAQQIVSGTNAIVLLAIPFFVLAGELMNAGGVTKRLVKFAEALTGGVQGGLAYVVVIVNMIMAGVSGAAIADAAAVGSVMIPSMERAGYSKPFASAVNAAAATIGPVIPPSVGFLIYASVANVPVDRLFIAGAVPGVIMGVYMLVVCYAVARRRRLPKGQRTSLIVLRDATFSASWAILMPVIILGGILGGVVTPTEAGVVAVVYGFFVGTVVYGELKLRDLPRVLARTAQQSATILLIIACAKAFGWVVTREGGAEMLLAAFDGVTDSPWVFLLIVNAVVIVLGCFMEGGSIMIILTPLLLASLARFNVDLVHFGVVFQLNIMLGLLTPPVGMLLYVITGVSGVKMHDMLRELWPFFIVLVLILLMITFIPPLTLWLPDFVYSLRGASP